MGTKSRTFSLTETRPGYYAVPNNTGLYLQVTKGKPDAEDKTDDGIRRSFVFRYTSPITSKRREMGLGALDKQAYAGSQKQAQARARKLRGQILDGLDPLEEKQKKIDAERAEQSKRITFDDAAAMYIKAKRPEWGNAKHADQWENTLRMYASPVIGKIPVQLIDVNLVHKVLEPIWTTKTETASRVRQRIEAIMDYCKAKELITGENPAAWRGNLKHLLASPNKIAKVEHFPALPYVRMHEFITELRKKSGISALALEFLIQTAARTGEVIDAKWCEIDLDTCTWIVPAERMKTGVEHKKPLNQRAVEILKTLHATATSEFIFPGSKAKKDCGLSNAAMLALMKGMAAYKQFTPHGFRSSFRDWAAECTDTVNIVCEMALAHAIPDKVEKSYRRGELLEKRKVLMHTWGAYIDKPAASAQVVELREKTA